MTAMTQNDTRVRSDRSFFLAMAGAIAVTVAVGFSVSLARRR